MKQAAAELGQAQNRQNLIGDKVLHSARQLKIFGNKNERFCKNENEMIEENKAKIIFD